MNIENQSVDEVVKATLEQDQRNRNALALLLDQYANQKDQYFVQRLEMGGTESFIGTVSLEWFALKVSFASELPLFKEKIDEDGRVIVDKDTIDEILQRPLNYARQSELAQYLAARKQHKFPPVLVVISQDWVDQLDSDEWDADGRAVISAARFSPLDSQGKYGLLDLSSDMRIFALDGQHRLLGVQGLIELVRKGKLVVLDKKGKQKAGREITADALSERYGISSSHLQTLASERIGVEFISAVVPGETRPQAKRRVRSIFVHVNRMAAPLTKGQLHQLDEDSGFALVAKKAAVSHPLLKSEGRVNWDSNTIATRSTSFTTLQTIAEMAGKFLGKSQFPHWDDASGQGLIPMRPEDSELDEGLRLFEEMLTGLADLPSVSRMVQGTSSVQLRNFTSDVVDKESGAKGEGNLLFRPVGQQVVAETLGHLANSFDLEKLIKRLKQYDSEGGFAAIDQTASVWYGVLFDPNGARMLVKGQALAVKILKYLLGGQLSDSERDALRHELADSRTIEGETMGFDGTKVAHSDLKLPNPIVL